MRKQPWSDKRERQYEQLRDGLEQRGRSEDSAEEIAARTVNKERAQAGEAKEASATSTQDKSASKRAGQHSHEGPRAGRATSSTRMPSASASTADRRWTRTSSSAPSTAWSGGAESANAGVLRALRASHSHLFQGVRLR